MATYLIDYENVKSEGIKGIAQSSAASDVYKRQDLST